MQGNSIPHQRLVEAAAITIFLGSIITGAACIANDNVQDLKVGHLLGATPWKQQLMLMMGAVTAAMIVPLIMQVLFNAYGIGNVLPRAGMQLSQALPAPPAALMAALTQAVFNHDVPWNMMGVGALIIAACIGLNLLLTRHGKKLSVLGIAIGIYLPLSSSTPIFIGGLIAFITQRKLKRSQVTANDVRTHRGVLLACGLVAGAALMDVILAVPFALSHSPDMLNIMPSNLHLLAEFLGIITAFSLGIWFYRVICYSK